MAVSKLKLARMAAGFTQEELARQLDVTRVWLGLIERGQARPSMALEGKVAAALNVSRRWLFEKGSPHEN